MKMDRDAKEINGMLLLLINLKVKIVGDSLKKIYWTKHSRIERSNHILLSDQIFIDLATQGISRSMSRTPQYISLCLRVSAKYNLHRFVFDTNSKVKRTNYFGFYVTIVFSTFYKVWVRVGTT